MARRSRTTVTARGSGESRGGLYSGLVWFLVCLSLTLVTCRQKPKPAPAPAAVTVVQPLRQQVTDFLALTGNTQAIRTVQLRARVAGYLEKVLFQDGQFVKEGQPLFIIQQNTYEASLRQAEGSVLQQKALLEYAGTELVRYSKLLTQKAAAQIDVDNWRYQRDTAGANLITAQAQADLAKLNLGYTEVTAPFDGRIDRRLVDPGNLVGSSEVTVLASLNQVDPMYVYFTISDSDLARLVGEAGWKAGHMRSVKWPAYIGVLNEEGYPHAGRLDFASISLTPTTGTLLLRAIFPNADGKVLPGLFARIRVPLKQRSALLVPQSAIGNDQQGTYVLTVNAQNTVVRAGVKMGPQMDHMRVIESGLTGSEWVVTRGVQKATPGRAVTPERQQATPVKDAMQPVPAATRESR